MKIVELKQDDPRFPKELREISDCPKRLFCLGNLELLSRRKVAIVGSRKFSSYGKNVARKFSKVLAQNDIVIVSGLALGIDSEAHGAALEFKESTIAVLGTAIDEIYPRSNRNLAMAILKSGGLIISEFAPQTPFGLYNFPLRNRIIAGLSEAVIVAEAALGSGSLITARLACEYNRRVFAVPQNINSYNAGGVNSLLKEGAEVLSGVSELGDFVSLSKDPSQLNLSKSEREVYESIQCGSESFDELVKKIKMDTNSLGMALVKLELNGLIRGQSGKYFVL